MQPVNRIEPKLPAQAYLTYQIASPRDTTIRTACEQAGCLAWRHGWDTTVNESITCGPDVPAKCRWLLTEKLPCGRCQAHYIRCFSQRTFRESRTAQGLTVFRFESGQRCFADHQTRPESYFVTGGDWRQSLGLVRRHNRAADWVEDMQENQGRISDRQQRG